MRLEPIIDAGPALPCIIVYKKHGNVSFPLSEMSLFHCLQKGSETPNYATFFFIQQNSSTLNSLCMMFKRFKLHLKANTFVRNMYGTDGLIHLKQKVYFFSSFLLEV